jgi:hypothetical protein
MAVFDTTLITGKPPLYPQFAGVCVQEFVTFTFSTAYDKDAPDVIRICRVPPLVSITRLLRPA